MDLFEKFTSPENLNKAFFYFKNETNESSLPLDPLWQPTINIIDSMQDSFFATLSKYLQHYNYEPDIADYLYAPKDNSGVRPVAVLSTTDRIIYQSILNPEMFGGKIDKRLLNCCYGNRVSYNNENYLVNYKVRQNKFYRDQIKVFEKGIYRVVFDIKSFYKSIVISKLINILEKEFGISDKKILNLLEKQLRNWDKTGLGIGIPQGPDASRVLANAYLHPLDEYVNNFKDTNVEYFRYADDIVLMSKNPKNVHDVLYKITIFLQKYNLDLNEKTKFDILRSKKELENKMYSISPGLSFIPSEQTIKKIKKELPIIFRRTFVGKATKKDKSSLKYYLKSSSDTKILSEIIKMISILPSLMPEIVRYIEQFINNNDIYKQVWDQYNKITKRDWDEFWVLKLLCSSIQSIGHESLQKKLDKIIIGDAHYSIRLVPLYYKASHDDLRLRGDFLKKLIRQATAPVAKSSYLYLANYTEDTDFVDIAEDFLKENSFDLQITALFLINNGFIKNIDYSNIHNFSKIFLGLPMDVVVTNNKEEMKYAQLSVKLNPDQFLAIKEPLQSISTWLGTKKKERKKYNNKNKKIAIFISDDHGIYKDDVKSGYPVRGSRAKLLRHLRDGKKDGKILTQIWGHNNHAQLSKDIKGINKLFKNKLKQKEDIVVHVQTGGYKLNDEIYAIKFIDKA